MKRAARIMAAIVVSACRSDAIVPPDEPGSHSFSLLRSEVFSKSCAVSGCHVGASVPASGGLSLAGEAYDDLVNVLATQPAARQNGLRRVLPGKPDSSLLYLKLLNPPRQTGHDYGNTMPVGAEPLSAGQVEFVLQWIASGAPKTGEVANAALLADRTSQTTAFQPLPPPEPGAGYQLRVDPFVVSPNFERELFVYRRLGNASDIYVKSVHFKMRPNSHHFVLYTFHENTPPQYVPQTNTVRDIRRPDGSLDLAAMTPMAYHVFFGGSMQTEFAYDFPAGVALRMPADAALDLNVHYANHLATTVTGEGFVNLYTADAATVQHVAKTLNMPHTGFSLLPNKRTTLEKPFFVNQRTTIFALTSHMHRLGEKFVIEIVGGDRDGEKVYESTSWEHPNLLFLNTPIVLEPGQGLKSIITWNNTTAQTVSWGLLSTDEMGIIFGYYY